MTTMGFVGALVCLAVGTVVFVLLFRKAALHGYEADDPEERLQDLEGGRARWWEVAMSFLVVAALVAWDAVALRWSRWSLRRQRFADSQSPMAKTQPGSTHGTMGGRVAG